MNADAGREEVRKMRANVAADWFLRLKDDDVGERELSEWLEWCGDPENLSEFQRTRNAWRSFDQLGPAAAELLETLLTEREVRPRLPQTIGRQSVITPREGYGSASRRQNWLRGVAAMFAATIAISGMWYVHERGMVSNEPRPRHRAHTRLAIQSSVLPDGSALTLAPRTELAIDFGGGERKLVLSNGDAYFDVRPDNQRPFVVQAGRVRVTAVGTAFDVRARTDRVTVTVQDGIVEVARVSVVGTDDRDAWRVSAGHQISYDVSTGAARIMAVDPKLALSWREGRLEYFSEPLGSVVADISRYSERPIEIGDPQLAQLSFTGTVFTASTDDWLAAVESTFPVRVVMTRDDHVLLLWRPPESASHDQ